MFGYGGIKRGPIRVGNNTVTHQTVMLSFLVQSRTGEHMAMANYRMTHKAPAYIQMPKKPGAGGKKMRKCGELYLDPEKPLSSSCSGGEKVAGWPWLCLAGQQCLSARKYCAGTVARDTAWVL